MNKEEVLEHVLLFEYGGMSKNELAYLYDICTSKDVLELGSMIGMSSYVIASVAKSLSCVDVWSDTWEHLEYDPKQQEIYKQFTGVILSMYESFKRNCKIFIDSEKIKMYKGNTNEMANKFLDKSFDVILIDADHSYGGISQDFNLYQNKIKNSGLIVFHDYGDSMWTGIKQFADEMVSQNKIKMTGKAERIAVFEKIIKQPKAKIIISRFKEDFNWVKEYTDDYLIYNKGEPIDNPHIINTENIGGNQRDIFKFIHDFYDDLPELMAFMQADPFDHCKKETFDKLIYNEYFTSLEDYGAVPANAYEKRDEDGGFLEINNSWYIAANNITYNVSCKYSSFDQFMEKYFSNYKTGSHIRFSPGSQYIIEKKQALHYPKTFWKSLMDELSENFMSEGHIIERSLWLILQCGLIIR